MKALVVAEQLRRDAPGGIGTYVRGLVEGLGQASLPPHLWASRQRGRVDPLDLLGAPVITSRLPSQLLTRAWDRNHVKAPEGFDVVHATSLAIPASAGPMTAMIHDLAWRQVPEAFPARGRRWHEAALGRAIERCTKFIVPSSQTANDLIEAGVAAKSVEVIAHGSDHLPPPDDEGGQERLRAAGVDPDQPYLLAVGTLEPRKNLVRLLEAYQLARPRLPEPWPLVIVGASGWGNALDRAEGVAIVSGASDAELVSIYEGARTMAYVPLLEGYGLPVVEAMSLEVPVVVSSVPAAGDAGYRVDPLNTAAIAEALVRVSSDDALRRDLIVAGRNVASRHTWRASAAAHVNVWESLQ
jgi:glycosyltransferase involved in cell wall biosynthesis